MSAWIVSKAHIDVLIHAMGRRELLTMSPDAAGWMLWDENHQSVNYRYGESEPTPTYAYAPPVETWTSSELLKILNCFDYQTCEHPGWKGSETAQFCEDLEAALVREGAGSTGEEYDAAPWGVPDCGHRHPHYADCSESGADQ